MSMTHDEMIAVIAHHRDGGEVECKHVEIFDYCLDSSPCFDFSRFDYRAKPEPLVLWAVYNIRTKIRTATHNTIVEAEQQIQRLESSSQETYTIKKFIEEL